MSVKSFYYRNPKILTITIVPLFYCGIFISIISAILLLQEFNTLLDLQNRENGGLELLRFAKYRFTHLLIRAVQLMTFIINGILFLIWLYRANSNARALGAKGMQFSPGWSIGWYFILIACLWKPYQAVKEIWRASSNPPSWETARITSLLNYWWSLWIINLIILGPSIFGRIFHYHYGIDDPIKYILLLDSFGIIFDFINIMLFISTTLIVKRIYSMQSEKARHSQLDIKTRQQ